MSILNDKQIRQLAEEHDMISPFIDRSVRNDNIVTFGGKIERKVISYGLSSYGYDARLAEDIEIFSNLQGGEIDPAELDEQHYVKAVIKETEDRRKYFILPPNCYALGHTAEYFKLPRDILAIVLGKSTLARAGLIINTTPAEPGWEGQLVLELANATSLPMRVYVGQGIAQFLFFRGEECEISYGDRAGKYQGQKGLTRARL